MRLLMQRLGWEEGKFNTEINGNRNKIEDGDSWRSLWASSIATRHPVRDNEKRGRRGRRERKEGGRGRREKGKGREIEVEYL
jgi:hypothetical protein